MTSVHWFMAGFAGGVVTFGAVYLAAGLFWASTVRGIGR